MEPGDYEAPAFHNNIRPVLSGPTSGDFYRTEGVQNTYYKRYGRHWMVSSTKNRLLHKELKVPVKQPASDRIF